MSPQQIPKPQGGRFILIEGYWISAGDKEPTVDETYVLTPSVKLNLKDIVRVVSAGYVCFFFFLLVNYVKVAYLLCPSSLHCLAWEISSLLLFYSELFLVQWLEFIFLSLLKPSYCYTEFYFSDHLEILQLE